MENTHLRQIGFWSLFKKTMFSFHITSFSTRPSSFHTVQTGIRGIQIVATILILRLGGLAIVTGDERLFIDLCHHQSRYVGDQGSKLCGVNLTSWRKGEKTWWYMLSGVDHCTCFFFSTWFDQQWNLSPQNHPSTHPYEIEYVFYLAFLKPYHPKAIECWLYTCG